MDLINYKKVFFDLYIAELIQTYQYTLFSPLVTTDVLNENKVILLPYLVSN